MSLNELAKRAHKTSKKNGFWENDPNLGEKIALMHSELSEALEAIRKSNMVDKHLPHLPAVGVELADTIIRILDYCAHENIDIDRCVQEKMAINEKRGYKHGKEF